MTSDEAPKKKSAKHRRANRKQSKSSDSDDQHKNPHVKVKRMLRTNKPGNMALVKRERSVDRSEHIARDGKETEEEGYRYSAREGQRQPSPAPRAEAPGIPTEEDLRRLAIYVQLRAEAASYQSAQGHLYDGVEVSGNACVVQGNAFDGDRPEQQLIARRHEYRNSKAYGASLVWTGDMTHKSMAVFFQQHKNNGANNFHYGQTRHGTDNQ